MKRNTIHKIVDPLVIIFENKEGTFSCGIHPDDKYKPSIYGVIINDLVQHVANAFNVGEQEVWKWVDEERFHPDRGKVQEIGRINSWGDMKKDMKE
jgi:hypothetical protein